MTPISHGVFSKIDDYRWEIPQDFKPGMKVPGIIYADEKMLDQIQNDNAAEQVANVAFLPGIIGKSMAMPDIHWGYGFPIGGVAATRFDNGVISPGGVGFDINCGVRLLSTNLTEEEVRPKIDRLLTELFNNIPSGIGSEGKIRLNIKEIEKLLVKGSAWAVEKGYGEAEDLEFTEEQGCMKGANPDEVSDKAKKRGMPQVGTLGSGNHFIEIQVVKEIFDSITANTFGIMKKGQILLLIHTGSRGLGYQVCDDYLKTMISASHKYDIELPDRQLACAPIQSPEGQAYFAAMACSANYAWANRQFITHWARESFSKIFSKGYSELGMGIIYDVAHNIAKIEKHQFKGKTEKVCVHRKGAIRAFPAGHPDIPKAYQKVGQPVLIPGDMGRFSYIAVGTQLGMEETWGSTCHGAGRIKSRSAAKRSIRGEDVVSQLEAKGIAIKVAHIPALAEEAPLAYKDIADVIHVTDSAGISRMVAKAGPIGVIKG